jgi:ketosteroid isomerase-like protein
MDTSALLRAFCDAVEQHDGKAFAELFTEDGIYHDVFYGAFVGRAKIAEMIDDWFYRTATDFRWDMHAPVSDGHTLYARYTFSYRSTLPEARARGRCSRALRSCGCATAGSRNITRSPTPRPVSST